MNDNITKLLHVMAQLRDPETGCVWDKQQNFTTIAPYTLEEAFEVVDAINRNNMPDLRDELGDLLLQVVFHAQMAQELGHFDFHAVVDGLIAKLIRRHPHVFGDAKAENTDDVAKIWQTAKEKEREIATENSGDASDKTPITQMFSALMQAQKISSRAAKTGFDWQNPAQVMAKLHEEIAEYNQATSKNDQENIAEELGDMLFCMVNLIRKHELSAEMVMLKANLKFQNRFHQMMGLIKQRGINADTLHPDQWESLWQQAKQSLKP